VEYRAYRLWIIAYPSFLEPPVIDDHELMMAIRPMAGSTSIPHAIICMHGSGTVERDAILDWEVCERKRFRKVVRTSEGGI
jgi:hypothetical protein